VRFEFHATAVIVDCGDAHTVMPYTEQNLPDRLVVTVRGGGAPATVVRQPNGTLAGSGNIDVTGRVVTGATDSGVTFAPRTARCTIGTLAAQ
jgi:hypothetical protein